MSALEIEIRRDEVERCALLAEDLAARWEASAEKWRREHTFTTGGWIFPRRTHVYPAYAKAADDMDSAAHGLRIVARGMREGWDTRKLGVDGDGL